jgi:pyruvate-formate lyase-activating enzyme
MVSGTEVFVFAPQQRTQFELDRPDDPPSSYDAPGIMTARGHMIDGAHSRQRWKQRFSSAGLHLFDRTTGLNVLLDEIRAPASLWSRAPRQVSIALTNRCDLACAHCYAAKSRDQLRAHFVTRWLSELDENGALGVGFGGGEPTLHPDFVELCQYAARETRLSVSFTTHGHHVDEAFAEAVQGSIHFIRVSMDGVGATYEAIRRRSFRDLQAHIKLVRSISRFGINIVVNALTLPDIDNAAKLAADLGACEFLLLPQVSVRGQPGIGADILQKLRRWAEAYQGPLTLFINESSADGFPTCDPLREERGLHAYAHIDAAGVLKATSYQSTGVPIGANGVLSAIDRLARDLAEKNDT